MVAIDTLSWQKDAKPVHWECDGGTEYDMQDGTRTEVGTCITLFLNEDCLQFCNEYKDQQAQVQGRRWEQLGRETRISMQQAGQQAGQATGAETMQAQIEAAHSLSLIHICAAAP